MSYSRLLNERCSIFRHGAAVSDSITHEKPMPIYENIKCRLVRKTAYGADSTKRNGVVTVSVFFMLYLGRGVDVKNGDLVFVRGEKYTVSEPNAPCGHHKAVMLRREGEA